LDNYLVGSHDLLKFRSFQNPFFDSAGQGIYNGIYGFGVLAVERIAKIFYTNRSQAVRLPKDFQFSTTEVYIRRQGENVILSPRPTSWDDYLAHGRKAPADFMSDIEDLPPQERSF
jgi:antitoxin VapB